MLRPLGRARLELTAALLVLPPRANPLSQHRPGRQQDLVREIDACHRIRVVTAAGRDQAPVGQVVDHRVDLLGRIARGCERGPRLLAARRRGAIAELDQAQQHASRDVPPGRRELVQRAVGSPRHHHGEAGPYPIAHRVVLGQAQHAAGPVLPELQQGVLQERQRAGLVGHVVQQALDEHRLEVDAERPRRRLDRRTQVVATQRAHVRAATGGRRDRPIAPTPSAEHRSRRAA